MQADEPRDRKYCKEEEAALATEALEKADLTGDLASETKAVFVRSNPPSLPTTDLGRLSALLQGGKVWHLMRQYQGVDLRSLATMSRA